MSKKMLFNAAEPEEIRAAIIDETNQLLEYDIETRSREQNRNNIYRGYVVGVETSIQAAFVEYGTNRHGFLPFREIHPDFWSRKPKNGERINSIEQVIRKGQSVLVQVVREEVDHKGAALTTYCTLPGRYLVLMPRSENSGISRKIEDPSERKQLRDVINTLKPPEGFGFIVRTAGLGKTEIELRRDLDILVRLWKSIQKAAKRGPRIGLIFQEADIIQRMIRDYHDTEIDEILIDEAEAFERAHTYFSAVMPNVENVVKFYEAPAPLFASHNIEDKISSLYERRVPLPSGGSIVIDTTEALVAIDVNSGKTQSDNSDETAYRANCEAAAEIARQLRLRDLGGLVVIDFISMRLTRHLRGVERALEDALNNDKARIRIGRLTSVFGVLTLTRQRIRDNKEQAQFLSCPACRGVGKYPNLDTNALNALRHLQQLAMLEQYDRISAALPREVAMYLLNHKRERLVQMENDYDLKIVISPKESIIMDLERDISVQIRRRERRERRERTPIQSPYEKLNNDASSHVPQQEDIAEPFLPSESTTDLSLPSDNIPESRALPPLAEPQPEPTFPQPPPSFSSTNLQQDYFADGWDKIAAEQTQVNSSYPIGIPWFLRHLSLDPEAPSLKLLTSLPQPALTPTRNAASNSHSTSASPPPTSPSKPSEKPTPTANSSRSVEPVAVKSEAPKIATPAPRSTPSRPSQSPPPSPQPTSSPKQETVAVASKEPPAKEPSRTFAPAPSVEEVSENLSSAHGEAAQPVEAESQPELASEDSSETPDNGSFGQVHPANRPPPTAPPPTQKPSIGSIWSSTELAKIREAAQEEQRRLTRWDRNAQGEGGMDLTAGPENSEFAAPLTPPPASSSALHLALAPPQEAPTMDTVAEATTTPEVEAPLQEVAPQEVASSTTEVAPVEEAPEAPVETQVSSAENLPAKPAKTTASSAPAPKAAGGRSRWTEEEVSTLESLCHLPLMEAKEAFEAKGFSRSLNAFRNRYYSLRETV